ncbi:hypothetical protein P3T37_003526 [Kitasatospora sp. MAA4]|uniref:hypothetical protein n=1 Tax=Kitasatospora sp. MAA4 TaxID=3035093 RepID=UPI0024741813|nr:hypothetical protein [Kitasatospora sp. MAA4]MDH6134124.1 hypothetical protein [Kitasatospora sp. MAA4]
MRLVLAAGLSMPVEVTVDHWWRPFPDALPRRAVLWAGVGILGVRLAAFRLPRLRRAPARPSPWVLAWWC